MTKEEAIRHLYTYSSTNGSGQTTQEEHEEAKRMAIKALKAQQWIPCSEQLPEEEGYYWTVHSYMSGHIGYNVSRFAKDLYKVNEYDFAEWKGVSGFFTIDDEYGYVKVDALAWMPIEPWRGEENGISR